MTNSLLVLIKILQNSQFKKLIFSKSCFKKSLKNLLFSLIEVQKYQNKVTKIVGYIISRLYLKLNFLVIKVINNHLLIIHFFNVLFFKNIFQCSTLSL